MATKHEIEIVIAPNGEVRLDVKGFKGPACLTVVQKLAAGLGPVTSTDLKPEYYESVQGTQQQRKR